MSVKAGIDQQLQQLTRLADAGYFVGLHIRFAAPLMLFQTYRQDWSDHYTDNGYALRDPMIAWGFSTTGVTRWSEMPVPDTFGILKEAASFGLVYGVCVSCGAISSRTIAGTARSDREFTDDELARLGLDLSAPGRELRELDERVGLTLDVTHGAGVEVAIDAGHGGGGVGRRLP